MRNNCQLYSRVLRSLDHFHRLIVSLTMIVTLLTSCCPQGEKTEQRVWLSTSFHEPADGGLRFIYSRDGVHWDSIAGSWLAPACFIPEGSVIPEGATPVMRDPSIHRSADGSFRLVWTCAWRGMRGFGFSSSSDLITWDTPRFLPVMEHDTSTVNVWAPEFFHDPYQNLTYIIWASCIPGAYPDYLEEHRNNHRLYCTTTRDFLTFSPTRLFFEPGFSVIDATLVCRGERDYVMVLKDNTRPCRNLRISFAPSPEGPWSEVSAPFTEGMCEGPTVIRPESLGGDYLIYYDAYSRYSFGAARTSDFVTFSDYSDSIMIPLGHKHGTMISVPDSVIRSLTSHRE